MFSRSSGEVKFDGSSCMLKPVYLAFVKTMLQFFCKLHILLITSTFAKTNEKNNRDDGFETRHFDEGKPCGEPPCTSLHVVYVTRLTCYDVTSEQTTSRLAMRRLVRGLSAAFPL